MASSKSDFESSDSESPQEQPDFLKWPKSANKAHTVELNSELLPEKDRLAYAARLCSTHPKEIIVYGNSNDPHMHTTTFSLH